MRLLTRAALLLLLTAVPAAAQVHVQLLGGVTNAADRNPFIGGALGARLGAIEIGVEGGRMFDIVPKGIITRLNELQIERGLPVQALARVPVTFALGTLRVISPSGPIRPFLLGGYGIARLEPGLDIVIGGISIGDVFGLTSVSRTDPMAAAGAGVRIDLGKGHLDIGYRYLRVFSDFLPDQAFGTVNVNVHTLYGALGVRF
jgi:hypothetical protein